MHKIERLGAFLCLTISFFLFIIFNKEQKVIQSNQRNAFDNI
jgi:hypothetical protein